MGEQIQQAKCLEVKKKKKKSFVRCKDNPYRKGVAIIWFPFFSPLKQLGLNSNRNFRITPEFCKNSLYRSVQQVPICPFNTVTALNIIKKIPRVLHVGSLLPKAGSILGVTLKEWILTSVQFGSVSQSCPTLCKPMNHSMPGLPIHHQLPEFTQTHVH